jgi:hypothetical protein
MSDADPLTLEPSTAFTPEVDPRPRMPEPPPVRLLAVNDVTLPAPVGAERWLDEFYIGLLRFQKDESEPRPAYRAERFRVLFNPFEGPFTRDWYGVLRIEVPCLADAEKALADRQVEYTRQRGLLPGTESLLLLDPAGNWIELVEGARIF